MRIFFLFFILFISSTTFSQDTDPFHDRTIFDNGNQLDFEEGEVIELVENEPYFPGGFTGLEAFVNAEVKKQIGVYNEYGLEGRYKTLCLVHIDTNGKPHFVQNIETTIPKNSRAIDLSKSLVEKMPNWVFRRPNAEKKASKQVVPFYFNFLSEKSARLAQFKYLIDTLCTTYFLGRGYVNNGHQKAADFIEAEMKRLGLQPKVNFQQDFPMPVNTFPGELSLAINDTNQRLGKDFIIHPYSPSSSGKLTCVYLPTKALKSAKKLEKFLTKKVTKETALVYRTADFQKIRSEYGSLMPLLFNAGAQVNLVDGKLTAFMAQSQFPIPVFLVKEKKGRVLQSIAYNVEAEFKKDLTSQNIIGYIPGKSTPDSVVVLGAHYDHLGGMGNIYFPGANDNASGVAMLLQLAEYFSQPANQPDYTLVFAAFGGEEVGLVGSKFYCENPLFPLSTTKFMMSLDLFGAGSKGITVVNSTEYPNYFDLIKEINAEKKHLPEIKPRKPSGNSDHHFFHTNGVPSFFIYTLGDLTAYHDIEDVSKILEYDAFENVFQLLKDFTKRVSSAENKK